MEFFEAVRARRSIRKFKPDPVPAEVMAKAFEAATLAPNSSNVQTWDFYWVRSAEKKTRLVNYCFGQSAARTAAELVVIVADPANWRRSNPGLVEFVQKINAPKLVQMYYKRLIPATYRWGFLNSLGLVKAFIFAVPGLFRPTSWGPCTKRDFQEVAIKSAALAAENLVLALSAQGYSTCMMEGFDEVRVKNLLGLGLAGIGGSARIVMVVGVGLEGERATWGPQYRIPQSEVVHEI